MERDRRVLTLVTLSATIGKGIFLTAGVLYFSRAVHLPAVRVGAGLSIAGLVALLAGVAAGHLADRRGARGCYVGALGIGAVATFSLLFAHDFWSFLVTVTVAIAAQTAGMVVRGPVINQIGGAKPQPLRAYVRATTNLGIALGAAVAGWAAQTDSIPAYRMLVVVNAVMLLIAALIATALPPVPVAGRQHSGRRGTAVRDLPYLCLAVLDGVLSIQYRILSVAIPLWIVVATSAPRWLISAAVILNTSIVVLFQVRASRTIDNPRRAGDAMRRAGLTFLISCALIASAAGAPAWAAATLVLIGVVVHTTGELWQAAGGFELSNELAPRHAVGQYLGVFSIGMGLAESIGPVLLTTLCIEWGRPGWFVVGLLLAGAGLLVPPTVRWATRTRSPAPAGLPDPLPAPASF
jgi:MFS family permease